MTENDLSQEKIYLKEIAKNPLLAASEEIELVIRAQKGDMEAKEKLIKSNLRLVVSIAKKYYSKTLDFLDLVEEGNYGLVKAIEKFNPEMKCRFSTYATWWIRKSIVHALVNNSGMIKVPENIKDIIRAKSELFLKLGREPLLEEIVKEVKIPKERIISMLNAYGDILSLNQNVLDSDKKLEDLIIDNNQNVEATALRMIKHEQIVEILKTIENISKRNLDIFLLRLGFFDEKCWTLEEIADKFGITIERVRQIEKMVLTNIRKSNKIYLLAEFMGNPSYALKHINNSEQLLDMVIFNEESSDNKNKILKLLTDFDIETKKLEIFCLLRGYIDGKCWTYAEIHERLGYSYSIIRKAERNVSTKIDEKCLSKKSTK